MSKPVLKWQIIGIIFIFLLGSLFHFIYEWSGSLKIVGLVSPVNESVWEHLKLVLFPSLLFMIIEYNAIKNAVNNYITAKTVSIITAMIAIVVIFYTYTFLLGHNLLIIDILSFLIAIMIGQFISYKILTSASYNIKVYRFSLIVLIFVVLLFTLFTISPPHIFLFRDPISGTYGI